MGFPAIERDREGARLDRDDIEARRTAASYPSRERARRRHHDALPEQIVVHLDHYETSTPEGMGALFRQFDPRISARSKQDVASAYQGLATPLASVAKLTAEALLGESGMAAIAP